MDRTQKASFVADLNAQTSGAASLIVAHYRGLTVKHMQKLRRELQAEGAQAQVAKNRLAKLALKDGPFANVSDLLTGPTVLMFGQDPVGPAKVAKKFAKDNEALVILGGSLDGKVLSVDDVNALASLPSLDELRGKLVGLLQAPATKLAGITQAPAGQLARVFGAYAKAA